MSAGHIVILAFISLIFSLGYVIIPVSIAFSLFIYLLEILVALLQAYIFTMLSALFIGLAIEQEH
jgi:F-type H+-transporting ATPase subunit a